jgi:hypothetical protein
MKTSVEAIAFGAELFFEPFAGLIVWRVIVVAVEVALL